MSQEEVDEFIAGRGLVEIEVDEPQTRMEVEAFLRSRRGYIATAEQTFKIEPRLLKELLAMGFEIREVVEEASQ